MTFLPVVRFDTIGFVLALSAERRMHLKHFDVKTAFLLARLQEDQIWIDPPEGFEDGTQQRCRPLQSLYGLKQAPRAFKGTFDGVMNNLGSTRSDAENSLSIKMTGGS